MTRKTILRLVILLTFIVNSQTGLVKKKEPRIVGGALGSISNMPYLVYLRRYGKFACGGALVSSRYVVTAAHCVADYPISALTLTGGTTYLNQGGLQRGVSRVFIAPNFSSSSLNNDVAVVKLKRPMTGSNIATIPLCSRRIPVGSRMLVTGWGITREGSSTPSTRVRTSSVKLRSKASCRRSYSGYSITRSMMCAATPRTDTCSGDSGGPVVFQGELCGVVSWGVGCARGDYPGIYTVVNRVKKFIQRSMNQ